MTIRSPRLVWMRPAWMQLVRMWRSVARVATRRPAGPGTWLQGMVHAHAGSRSYQVYVPAGLRRRSRVPLVVLLHGCRQSAEEFAASTAFNELADRHGFIAVYPQQSAWS